MTLYSHRIVAPLVLAAACALSACSKSDQTALQQDTSLSRDLARAGADTTAQPELKDVPPAPAPAPSQPRTTTPRRTTTTTTKTAPPAPAPAAPAETKAPAPAAKPMGSIAEGTVLALNSTEKVCTNTNKIGDRFTATVSSAVEGSNGAAIPVGSKVVIEVTELHRSENANDRIVMGFRVVSLTVDGKTYYPDAEVQTAAVDRVAASTGGDAAKKVIGGAVAGAIIGQIIGRDRKGTLIGAAAGAAAGGAAAAATANHDGCVNNGAPITVKLTAPLSITIA